jgi:hypothetical protein
LIEICALDANKQKDAPNGKPPCAAFVFSSAIIFVLYHAVIQTGCGDLGGVNTPDAFINLRY